MVLQRFTPMRVQQLSPITVFLHFKSLGSAIVLHKHVKEVKSLITRRLSVCFLLQNETLNQGPNLL